MNFGEKLRKLRKDAQKTQIRVAQDLHISQSYVSDLELSDTAPEEQLLSELARYYGVHISYFFAEDFDYQSASMRLAHAYLQHFRKPESE